MEFFECEGYLSGFHIQQGLWLKIEKKDPAIKQDPLYSSCCQNDNTYLRSIIFFKRALFLYSILTKYTPDAIREPSIITF